MNKLFSLDGRVFIITGGSGFLGRQHSEAIHMAGGIPIVTDKPGMGVVNMDVTCPDSIDKASDAVLQTYGRIDGLINNAANNPVGGDVPFEEFELWQWTDDLEVGLTGAFLCSRIIGSKMAKAGKGVIVNIASDLGVIAPDQRIYEPGTAKPVSYSVTKHALIGLTKYLATYWADKGIRANALSPGGMYNKQPDDFVKKVENLIPMGRMATLNEYQGALIFLCSDASSYMTGANLIVDGGRTCW